MLQIEKMSQWLNDASSLWQLDNSSSSGSAIHVLCDLDLVNTHLWARVSVLVKSET